jgi:hypothetical protein
MFNPKPGEFNWKAEKGEELHRETEGAQSAQRILSQDI